MMKKIVMSAGVWVVNFVMNNMSDSFFKVESCDRCGQTPLTIRQMSWFTEETLCMDCTDKEKPIKKALRDKGITDAMEGCGYIPEIPA